MILKHSKKNDGSSSQPSPKQSDTKTTWAGLFSKKERGPATFKNFSAPRGPITKNKNAMIIKITHLSNIATDDLIQALATNYNNIILEAKIRFMKLGRSHMEIIFKSYMELNHYITTGIFLLE